MDTPPLSSLFSSANQGLTIGCWSKCWSTSARLHLPFFFTFASLLFGRHSNQLSQPYENTDYGNKVLSPIECWACPRSSAVSRAHGSHGIFEISIEERQIPANFNAGAKSFEQMNIFIEDALQPIIPVECVPWCHRSLVDEWLRVHGSFADGL